MTINAIGPDGRFLSRDADERFWEKVEFENEIFPENGCMLWTAGKINGYGKFPLRHNKTVTAHRWLYERIRGPVPEGMQLDHLCRVRHCVNPDHLEPVSSKVNINRGETGIHFRQRTHCKHGHEYTAENTAFYRCRPRERFCLICKKERRRKYASQKQSSATTHGR